MLTDVAKSRRAEQRIGDGMQDNVGVAVAGEPAGVRHRDTAQHHRAFAGESVDVKAHAGARDQAAGQPMLGAIEVGWRVSFSSAGSP